MLSSQPKFVPAVTKAYYSNILRCILRLPFYSQGEALRLLSVIHPIYKLLDPHMRFILEINAIARKNLLNADGVIQQCFNPRRYCMETSVAAYKHWRFDLEGLLADFIRRPTECNRPGCSESIFSKRMAERVIGGLMSLEQIISSSLGLVQDLLGESTEDFIQRYKSESGNVKEAPECMRISGFVHGITNPELIKRFHEKIPKTVDKMMQVADKMMQVATSFLQGQEAASNQERKKAPQAWKHQEGGHRQNFKKWGASAANIRQRKDQTGSLFSQKLRRKFWP
ncbi:reverse transcriptase domain-containing protein [Tanacetum coccineum]